MEFSIKNEENERTRLIPINHSPLIQQKKYVSSVHQFSLTGVYKMLFKTLNSPLSPLWLTPQGLTKLSLVFPPPPQNNIIYLIKSGQKTLRNNYELFL